MRRIMTAAGTLAISGAMALGIASPAFAAHGTLVVPGAVVENPSGCVNAVLRPLVVRNETNEYALVYEGENCAGRVLEVIPPGGKSSDRYASEYGASVFLA
jgi:hypothetical protein